MICQSFFPDLVWSFLKTIFRFESQTLMFTLPLDSCSWISKSTSNQSASLTILASTDFRVSYTCQSFFISLPKEVFFSMSSIARLSSRFVYCLPIWWTSPVRLSAMSCTKAIFKILAWLPLFSIMAKIKASQATRKWCSAKFSKSALKNCFQARGMNRKAPSSNNSSKSLFLGILLDLRDELLLYYPNLLIWAKELVYGITNFRHYRGAISGQGHHCRIFG